MARRGLGKGLASLIPEEKQLSPSGENVVSELNIVDVEPNKNQPRKHFEEEALADLAESLPSRKWV